MAKKNIDKPREIKVTFFDTPALQFELSGDFIISQTNYFNNSTILALHITADEARNLAAQILKVVDNPF